MSRADKRKADSPASVELIAFTRRGCELAASLAGKLSAWAGGEDARIAVSGPARFAEALGINAYESLDSWTADAFARADALVYVGASGIAVRAIAPYVCDKLHDPAVVSVDEAGRFAVPLLSGHVGGANELARAVADATGGQAAVSTATDVNDRFAVDEWAARQGFLIAEREVAKAISARLLEGGTVGFATGFEWEGDLPQGIVEESFEIIGARDLGFVVSADDGNEPFERTLHLVPRCVTVGVGCRKGTDSDVLRRAVDDALAVAGVSRHAVAALASIDVKRDEPAIRELAEQRGWDLRFYSAEELAAVSGDFESSEFVRSTVGVDNVCERSACAQGAMLVLGKQSSGVGVTVALAMDDVRVRFD